MTIASHTYLVVLMVVKVSMVTLGTASEEPCVFPFRYYGKEYNDCTTENHGRLWCYTTNGWRDCDSASSWSVSYSSQSICAVEGSTVDMSCSYTHPSHLRMKDVYWINSHRSTAPDISQMSQYKGRVGVNCSDKQCSLRINTVKYSDNGDYYCRVTTNVRRERRTGIPGVKISVTDIKVSSLSGRVREGDNVTLTCNTTCPTTASPSFMWGKNGRPVEKKEIINNQLQLHPVSREDEGNYTCAVRGHENHPSQPERLTVTYPPQNMQIQISPSGKVTEGSHVTLTCMSEANPPVHTYTWIKRSGDVELKSGEKRTLAFSKIGPEDSGEYQCLVKNEIGQQDSPSVTVQVLYPPKDTSVLTSHSGFITKGTSVTLTCSSDANPPVENYTWFKDGAEHFIGSGQNFSITNITAEDGGWYYCEARNKYGAENSTAVSITVEVAADPSPVSATAVVAVLASVSVCLLLALVSAGVWIRYNRKGKQAQRQISDDQDDVQYSNIGFQRSGGRSRAAGPPSADEAAEGAEDDVQYASVQLHGSGQTAGGVDDDVQYASVQPQGSGQAAGGVDDDVQYASVQFKKGGVQSHSPGDAYSSTLQPEEEPSVIYTSLKHRH